MIQVQDPDILYDVVVLKPAHFSPFRCPLVFRDAPPAPVPQGQPITPVESYSMWSVQDGELRAFEDDVIRPPFKHATARRPPFLVNSLFWVLNAAWKFREFKRRYPDWARHVTIRGQRLMQLTQDLAAQIYWRPTYVPGGEVLDPIKINEYKTAEHAPEEKLAQKPHSGSKTETETARSRRDVSFSWTAIGQPMLIHICRLRPRTSLRYRPPTGPTAMPHQTTWDPKPACPLLKTRTLVPMRHSMSRRHARSLLSLPISRSDILTTM